MDNKWTNGKPYERSRRIKHIEQHENEQFTKVVEANAYTASLNHDETSWDILNQNNSIKGLMNREKSYSEIADNIKFQPHDSFLKKTKEHVIWSEEGIDNKFLKSIYKKT
jgi:hypothetical protein